MTGHLVWKSIIRPDGKSHLEAFVQARMAPAQNIDRSRDPSAQIVPAFAPWRAHLAGGFPERADALGVLGLDLDMGLKLPRPEMHLAQIRVMRQTAAAALQGVEPTPVVDTLFTEDERWAE